MALGANDPFLLHAARNLCLVFLSLFLFPVSFTTCIAALLLDLLGRITKPRKNEAPKEKTRVLITGVGMTKGLFLARTMYLGGCTVIGADFDQNGSLYCGRYSKAIEKFYALENPIRSGSQAYRDNVVRLVKAERINLWISCSGVATAIEDATLAKAMEESTDCMAFQLDERSVSTLDDKLRFMQKTSELNLANVEWYPLSSTDDVQRAVSRIHELPETDQGTKYIIKSAGMDDITRGALPILEANDPVKLQQTLLSLSFEKDRSWILQEYIESGEEYCTHAVVVNGSIRAFTACRSESVLMHYKQLDPDSILFKQMLQFTKDYALGLAKECLSFSGHLSFDFLIRYRRVANGFEGTLAPIECNPRCHTAVVLFRGFEKLLAQRYLEILDAQTNGDMLIGERHGGGFYWVAHDLVALLIVPLVSWATKHGAREYGDAVQQVLKFLHHLLMWRDPTFEWWDPLPWLVLTHVYWPVELILATLHRTKWKQLNVSTTKMFKC